MTPSALTPAARGTKKRPATTKRPGPTKRSGSESPARPSAARTSGHRTGLGRKVAPRVPRRVSGPAGGAATIALPAVAPRIAPPRTAPARSKRSRPRSRPAAAKAPWRIRSAAYVRRLPDHALLDRIIRGRAWIPILGVLLVGIVAMQVEVLKLNAGVGRSLERASALQSQNELLRAGVARLSDEQRIERIAAGMGMVMPAPEQMRFVRSGPVSVETALGSIKAPNATNFMAQLPTIGAPAAAQGTSTNTAPGMAGATATAITPGASTSATSPSTTSATSASSTGAGAASGPTSLGQASAAASTPATSAGTSSTSSGTAGSTASGTAGSTATGTPATSPVTPAAPTAASGTTGQSTPSSSGGATPVGG